MADLTNGETLAASGGTGDVEINPAVMQEPSSSNTLNSEVTKQFILSCSSSTP